MSPRTIAVVSTSQITAGKWLSACGRYGENRGVIEPPTKPMISRNAHTVTTNGATSTRPVRNALRRDLKRDSAMKRRVNQRCAQRPQISCGVNDAAHTDLDLHTPPIGLP